MNVIQPIGQIMESRSIVNIVPNLIDDVSYEISGDDVKYLDKNGVYVIADSNIFIHTPQHIKHIITRSKCR